ncbi:MULTISPECIES: glycosyltransferase [Thermodesulfovibrio]|uniref:Glycosyl transferase family 1 n=1 Tax=Thermodesulfovibrio yellowstonii TaxID=28262 RepID=A0A9W6GCF8_9BACT|nr:MULTISPECIES: glycosyltransferase [Thermodesulfovibrio]GLI52613.1 glycosyl transferase family 1 [Thermodesulfovibrio islandicus]
MDKELQFQKPKLRDYEPIIGKSSLEELKILADKLSGKKILNINSTYIGGGVAEILARMVPFLNELGVEAKWSVIKGDNEFFNITKKFHNALHGKKEEFKESEFEYFLEVNRKNSEEMEITGDIIFVHDPQPVALIQKRHEIGEKWLWRCHIDVSKPDERVWNFIKEYVEQYDASVFSAPNFAKMLKIRMFLIYPSIDPLSNKNKELSDEQISAVLDKYGIDRKKPIILQVSRFDYLKDPVGVIKAFEIVRKTIPCQLILAGGTATDDPESDKVLSEVKEVADKNPDIHILLLPPDSDIEINALQRAATVIVQKSIKEGFGLTVTEALWKGKPVVASAVGGILLQVKHKITGLLCHSIEGAAYSIKTLLSNPEFAQWLGKNGHAHVKQNFLITRHLKDYLLLFLSQYYKEELIYL